MDIFVIEVKCCSNVPVELLKKYQKKDIKNQKKWLQHCFSYLMLDSILRDYYNIENRQLIFRNKKPHLKSPEKHFSISHSDDFIVLAFSDSECGVDIEKVKTRNFTKISNRMGFECKNLEEFYSQWTKYEAEYKLGTCAQKFRTFRFEDYVITGVSQNIQENFEIFIQSGEVFSNLNT